MPHLLKIVKYIILVKVLIILLMLAIKFSWIRFNELPLRAQQSLAENSKDNPDNMMGSGGSKNQSDEKAEDRSDSGFLDNLLTLPALDVEKSSKHEVGRYLTMIEQAKQQVEQRIKTLKSQYTSLQALEQSIDKKLDSLQEERQFFIQTIQQEKKIQADRLDTLVDLYAKMEPKKAAPVFETMDKDLIVALFNKMKKKQVTRIMELINPQKSAELTEYFGRIRSGREYELLKEMNQSLKEAFDQCRTSRN